MLPSVVLPPGCSLHDLGSAALEGMLRQLVRAHSPSSTSTLPRLLTPISSSECCLGHFGPVFLTSNTHHDPALPRLDCLCFPLSSWLQGAEFQRSLELQSPDTTRILAIVVLPMALGKSPSACIPTTSRCRASCFPCAPWSPSTAALDPALCVAAVALLGHRICALFEHWIKST
eukprot:m.188019 g.188019  ORF g.188019 m.188019 type:complete len:174 (+) comp53591_c0_seq4:226-747(+)